MPGSLDDVRRFIGNLGVHVLAADPRQVENGVTVSHARRRRGFALQAVTGVLDHLFRALGKHRVTASIDPRNGASMALLRRAGMREEAHLRESLWFKGEWADDVVFAMPAREREVRQR